MGDMHTLHSELDKVILSDKLPYCLPHNFRTDL